MFGKWFKREDKNFLGKNKDSILFVGMDTRDREIWLSSTMLRQHVLVAGTTGSGKSEALMGLMSNAFAGGSGGVYIDGKGDIGTYAKMFTMAKHHGRSKDLYVLNFMSGSTSESAAMRTHRFNPFAKGSSDMLASFVVSLIPPEDFRGEGAMWKGRASAMFAGIMRALCWMRDHRNEYLDAATLKAAITLDRMIDMANSSYYSFLPDSIRRTLRSYLSTIEGYQEENGHKQSSVTQMRHGMLEMQFARIFGDMTEVYGHIFCAGTSDIDFDDLISNRRFLHVMLPAMEKSGDQISLLGRIVLASIKHTIGNVLAQPVRQWPEIRGGADDETMPFVSVFDDVSYYMIDGIDLLSAQARALGMAIVYSCSDVKSLSRVSKATFGDISSCAATKIIMRGNSSDSELNDVFFDVVPARDDVVTAIEGLMGVDSFVGGSPRRSVFRSPFTVVKHLDAGDFVLINSGKMLIGKFNYIHSFMPSPRRIDGLDLLHDHASVADQFLQLSQKAARSDKLPDISVSMTSDFIAGHEQSISAVQMLSHALKSLEPGGTGAGANAEEELVRIGA